MASQADATESIPDPERVTAVHRAIRRFYEQLSGIVVESAESDLMGFVPDREEWEEKKKRKSSSL